MLAEQLLNNKLLTVMVVSFCLLFIFSTTMFASNTADKIDRSGYYFEFLTFRADQGEKTYVEVLCQVPVSNLRFLESSNGFTADYMLNIAFLDSAGNKIDGAVYCDSTHAVAREVIEYLTPHVVQMPFLLNSGIYRVVINMTDLNNLSHFEVKRNLLIAKYDKSCLKMSDIELASFIHHTQNESSRIKNNMEVIPNVQRVFSDKYKKLYLYSEIYNLFLGTGRNNAQFVVKYDIRDEFGDIVKTMEFFQTKPGNTSFLCLAIPIVSLEAGQYQLRLTIRDTATGQSVGKSTHFMILNSGSNFVQKPLQKRIRPISSL